MTGAPPALTLGIEEEYLLVDRQSRDVVSEPPADVLEQCQARTDDLVRPEFLASQIEVGTPVCREHQTGARRTGAAAPDRCRGSLGLWAGADRRVDPSLL